MTQTKSAPSSKAEDKEAIRPFKFQASQADLDDLKRRVLATRLPEKEAVNDNSQGVPLATVQALAKYWATSMIGVKWKRE